MRSSTRWPRGKSCRPLRPAERWRPRDSAYTVSRSTECSRSTIRVDEHAVRGPSPPARVPRNRLGPVRAHVAGWPRPGASSAVPRLECGSRRPERRESRRELDEVGVVTVAAGCGIPAEVLAPESKPSVACEPASGIAAPGGIGRFAVVERRHRESHTKARNRASMIGGSDCRIRLRARCRRRRRPWRARRSESRARSRGRRPRRDRLPRRRGSRERAGAR